MEKSHKKPGLTGSMETTQTKYSINKGLLILILLIFTAGGIGCASLQGRVSDPRVNDPSDKTTLLLEEIQKEQAKGGPIGKPVEKDALWESAQIEKRWVPAQFRGNRYIVGHYEYVVVTPGRWKAK